MSAKILQIQSHQIKTLQCILLSQLKNSLIKVKTSLKERKQLRRYFQRVPATIRSELLNMVLCPYGNYGGTFYIFDTFEESFDSYILFLQALSSPGIDYIHLYFNFYGEKKFDELLQSVIQNVNKLKVFRLPRLRYIAKSHLTQYTILLSKLCTKNGRWLTTLELGLVCNDLLLRTIGETCYWIQNLNVETSEVSDRGIQFLTQIWECREGRGLANDEERVDESLTMCHHRATKHIKQPCNKIKNRNHKCRHLCYKTKLCHSLRRINVRYTKVTEKGIHALLSTVNNLEDIGICMAAVLDDLHESYEENAEGFQCPDWSLQSLFVSDLLPEHLTIIRKLTTIKNLKFDLLGVHSFATSIEHDVQNYLQGYGSNLTSLDVSASQVIDLSSCLKHCPNLISLKLKVKSFTWSDDKKPVPSPMLKFAEFRPWEISCESAVLFMESASVLKEVYFWRVEEDEKFLSTLCEKCISNELKVFFVEYPNFRSNPQLVSNFWQCHKHIEFIGDTTFSLAELQLDCVVDSKLIYRLFCP